MSLTVLSFYTPNHPYPSLAVRLEASCKQFDLDHLVSEVDQAPTWVETVAQKPRFVLRWLESLDTPVLWVDADGEIVGHPELLDGCEKDFAIYADPKPRRWRPLGRQMLELPPEWPGKPRWFQTGTFWVNNSPHGRAFLEEWAREAEERPKDYQQLLCQKVWCRVKPDTLWLPQAYCKIRNFSWRQGQEGPEVIVHDLASIKQRGIKRK